ncbi:hypothetical protein V8C86DRAFT_1755409 [Haematococcus lacustris]
MCCCTTAWTQPSSLQPLPTPVTCLGTAGGWLLVLAACLALPLSLTLMGSSGLRISSHWKRARQGEGRVEGQGQREGVELCQRQAWQAVCGSMCASWAPGLRGLLTCRRAGVLEGVVMQLVGQCRAAPSPLASSLAAAGAAWWPPCLR